MDGTTDWSGAAKAMLETRARTMAVAEKLPSDQRAEFQRQINLGFEEVDEADVRRKWAAMIREEFGKYHEHEGGHPCGACGSIQAANWMDPDYTGDGPEEN